MAPGLACVLAGLGLPVIISLTRAPPPFVSPTFAKRCGKLINRYLSSSSSSSSSSSPSSPSLLVAGRINARKLRSNLPSMEPGNNNWLPHRPSEDYRCTMHGQYSIHSTNIINTSPSRFIPRLLTHEVTPHDYLDTIHSRQVH
ncbi:uncharacterized protein BP01DRAFT_12506 [Aspergillus saccharolyticus JOP 1030-1]|uniref:Uncharacterized protein n=1 Tax=Aspergillus saccharolyticus JOP 1030-1 TaxID=1450539 RepID=A0A319A0H2_9EURO|nr:hypothetical protein BP01DRAFT_12506 [Aspergillus saccharolyticus JOP 1030-1]PYH50020.1 hypothetical protein BP01DRAFT_12506 [Aspergillus saccharolyticus JOP 1030-1]